MIHQTLARILNLIVLILVFSFSAFSQEKQKQFLPEGEYQEVIPHPADYFGFQPGEWHLSHDQLTSYLKEIAMLSDRVVYKEYARSHEQRPLFHLVITSPSNHERLDEIREEHLLLSDPERSAGLNTDIMQAVITMGYGVHGNESSASNASVLVAYFLAASNAPEVKEYLENMVILLDPCLNPDGFNRSASWINMHKSKTVMRDDQSRGFREVWPGGRTNHYWFDLNRDWLLLQHPESQGRVKVYQDWKPNVQLDFHEMGASSTFFFQPGVPGRTNPFTPQETTDLTDKIAKYHAKALDEIKTLYFTKERFDDFYYGKGSSYPDVNGGVGILFEQAGARGYERDTPRGLLTFSQGILNQVKVSLSSLEATLDMRKELLEHQRDFYDQSKELSENSEVKAYVFGENGDPTIFRSFVDVLLQHHIELHHLSKPVKIQDIEYRPGSACLVRLDQAQIRLIKSLFEPMKEFEDSIFYDISTWTFPYAYNIPYAPVTNQKTVKGISGKAMGKIEANKGHCEWDASAVGFLFSWKDYMAPGTLYQILKHDLIVQVLTDSFPGYGSIFIPVEKQNKDIETIHRILDKAAQQNGITIEAVQSSYTSLGPDMGSSSFFGLDLPKILLLTGDGISSLEAGEIWHLLDFRLGIPVVLLDFARLNSIDLKSYTHIIMPSGNYGTVSEKGTSELKRWIETGGTVIAQRTANKWLFDQELVDFKFKSPSKDSSGYRPYSEQVAKRASQGISGSIFNAEVDITHPIGYGLERNTIPLLRNSTLIAELENRPYAAPVRYTGDPLLSGYVPRGMISELADSPSVIISSRGHGRIVSFIDNPNFRGFWYGSNRLFTNAIFFGPIISSY